MDDPGRGAEKTRLAALRTSGEGGVLNGGVLEDDDDDVIDKADDDVVVDDDGDEYDDKAQGV